VNRIAWMICLITPTLSQAWDTTGHIAVGKIAEAHLTAEAKAGIKELLGERPISDLRICTWADLIRNSSMYDRKYPEHRTWHYINLELGHLKAEYKPTEKDDSVYGAIERYRKKVTDPELSEEDRKEALMFVVHFLQDMHQPLHCGNRNDDKGGNMQPIRSFDGVIEERLNLHWVWDKHLIEVQSGGLTPEDFALRLNGEIIPEEKKRWSEGSVADWIWESHEITVNRVYSFQDGKPFPKDESPIDLTVNNYIKDRSAIARIQLKKSGIRLAWILNDIFKLPEPRSK
jgi:hypothetical protein